MNARQFSLIAVTLLSHSIPYSSIHAQPAAPQAQTPPQPQQTTQTPPNEAAAESPNDLLLTVGKSVVVNSTVPIERVSVGFGDIAEAAAVGPKEVLVNGKAPGETSLIVWQQGGTKLFFDVTVRPSRFVANNRIEGLRREVKRELPDQAINITVENDTIFLRGNVRDRMAAERAIAIASTLGKVVNLLYVDVPASETQILLRVKFASVDRSTSTQLALNLVSTGATNTIGSITTQQFAPPQLTRNPTSGVTTVTLSDALNIFLLRPDINLAVTIKALESKSLLEVLAEPNVLAMNGRQASFLAGGEYPYPTLQGGGGGLGQVTVQYKEFGVRLNFIPTITARGTIRLQVAPEVSALDFTSGLNVQGFIVPALSTRRVNTEIELEQGQSFAIGGLLDNRLTKTIEKIPILGDIPWFGKIFQSKSLTKNNTELLVLVTPEIVRPIPAGHPIPDLTYPEEFLTRNSPIDMRTPGMNVTGPVPVTPPSPVMPYESYVESLRPETPLIVEGKGSTYPPQPQQGFPAILPMIAPAPAAPPPAAAPPTK